MFLYFFTIYRSLCFPVLDFKTFGAKYQELKMILKSQMKNSESKSINSL